MAQFDETQTEAIFRHHLGSILTKDVDAVLEGFAEDGVIFPMAFVGISDL